MKSLKYLDKLKEKTGMNDAEISRSLKISKAAISQYKSGARIMDDETCLAIALALDINPMEVIGAACIDRAEKSGQKSLWEVFTMRTAQGISAALCLVLAVTLFLTPSTGEARPAYVLPDNIYIMLN